MKNSLQFLLNVAELKTIKRTGWVWLGIKNPETIAEHSFRTSFFTWILGAKTNLRVRRMIEMALLHDVCEVYAGDLTPYFGVLPKDKKKRKEILYRWIRLPQKQKRALSEQRFRAEKKALVRLIKPLSPTLQKEVYELWVEYEKGLSQEGKFVKQVDKLEAMLQAIEYFGTGPGTPVVGWWEEAEELVVHPALREFLHSIEEYLYENKRSAHFRPEIDFLMNVGRLKRNPKAGWVIRKVKNPDSFANHAFFLMVLVWLFAKEHGRSLNLEKMLKMALCQDLPAAFLPERTPYDDVLSKARSEKERKKLLEKWIRLPLQEKQKMFRGVYRQETKALEKLASKIDARAKKEILGVWREFKENKTKEAHFVNHMYVQELLVQALLYWEANKRFPIKAWWEWAFESSDLPFAIDFMAELKRVFITSSQPQSR